MRSIGAITAIAAVLLTGAALAMPAFQPLFNKEYPVKQNGVVAKASCEVCNVSSEELTRLNPYGKDLKGILEKEKTKKQTAVLLHRADGLDSDKDGVENADELKKDTLPGNPKSKWPIRGWPAPAPLEFSMRSALGGLTRPGGAGSAISVILPF